MPVDDLDTFEAGAAFSAEPGASPVILLCLGMVAGLVTMPAGSGEAKMSVASKLNAQKVVKVPSIS